MWTYRHLLPVFILITLVEIFIAAEHVPEEVCLKEVMHCGTMTGVQLDWPALAGVLAGCLFACWWMHVRRFSYLRLIIVGTGGIICYLACCYFLISSDIHITQFHLPVFCRSFAYAVLSAAFMTCLEEIMSFRHFFVRCTGTQETETNTCLAENQESDDMKGTFADQSAVFPFFSQDFYGKFKSVS